MLCSTFWSLLGLLLQAVGAFICIQSFIFTNPKALAAALRSIHGSRISDRNLDKNLFLDSLVRQSLDAQGGFAIIIMGSVLQGVSTLFTQLYLWKIWFKPAVVLLVFVPPLGWLVAKNISNW